MIFSYNKEAVGDTLLVIAANVKVQEVNQDSRGLITRVFVKETGETVGWNFFDISTKLTDLKGNGQVHLTNEQLALLNELLAAEGFSEQVTDDRLPKIVTGFVKSCKVHPDSDHLSITQTEVDNGDILQIVCGAPNIKAGLKVVVAKPGAMMPDGLVIWPGELRGEVSHGMICSARELHVPNAPVARGILELPFDNEVGKEFIGSNYIL